jgi:hypothetical protein
VLPQFRSGQRFLGWCEFSSWCICWGQSGLSSGLALSLACLRIVDRMSEFVVVDCGARSFSWWWGLVCHAIRDLVQIPN